MSAFEEGSVEHEVSGLARDIRAIITSDQFDLGGYTETRAKDLVHQAFSKPLTAPTEMIRITFVVGGGKLVRSRYAEDLPKWMMTALRDIGFSEDRSAAETFDSQGTFKHQHDVGQNLKYVIVYPHVACATAKASSSGASNSELVMDESSPEYIVLACELPTFQEIVTSKVFTYSQKKKLLKFLQQKSDEFKAVEAKLIAGEKLTHTEQFIYDNVSETHEQKVTWLQAQIKEAVDNGQITAREKAELIQHIESNIAATQAEIDQAKAENKPKKVEKLEAKKDAALQRKAAVEKVAVIPPRLRLGDDIRKVYIRLFPLLAMEDKQRSMSLTLADLKLLEEKPDLEQQIISLQQQSKGWFEEDAASFTERCQYEEAEAKRVYKHRQSEKKGGSGGGAKTAAKPTASFSSSSAWTTVSKKPGSSASAGRGGAAGKKATSSFAAAFDNDSDDSS